MTNRKRNVRWREGIRMVSRQDAKAQSIFAPCGFARDGKSKSLPQRSEESANKKRGREKNGPAPRRKGIFAPLRLCARWEVQIIASGGRRKVEKNAAERSSFAPPRS